MISRSLQNRVALVTGSSKGLGAAIASRLAREGARVVINACHDLTRAENLAAQLISEGHQAIAIGADVTKAEEIDSLVRRVSENWGAIDILVPNATPDQPQLPIEKYSTEHYRTLFEFFSLSPLLLAQAILPGMKSQAWGRIINITSEVYANSMPQFSAYVAAKGGQIGWSRSMAKELAPFGITVNMVAPGWIPVERHEEVPASDKEAYLATIPAGRWGTPDDVAQAVAFFAQDASGFITGQTLHVNGGLTPW